jgi:cytochrome c553
MSIRILTLSALVALAASATALADSPAASVAQGKQLVNSQGCAMCHHSPGMAKPLSSFAGDSVSQLEAIILDPKKALGPSTMMPPYEGKLTAAQVDAIAAFIKAGGS